MAKKLPATNEMEEELLRARSILSVARKAAKTYPGNEQKTEGGGNENRQVSISPAMAQEMKDSLEAKLRKLNEITKLERKGSVNKRKLAGDTDEEVNQVSSLYSSCIHLVPSGREHRENSIQLLK